jgi:hypothetical protein
MIITYVFWGIVFGAGLVATASFFYHSLSHRISELERKERKHGYLSDLDD